MANVIMPAFKEHCLDQTLTGNNLKVVLVDLADYTFSSAHEFLSDVAAGARVATSGNLTSVTLTGGVLDADDTVFTSATGDQSEALYLYIDTGSAATSRLIAFFDTASGLAVTPDGNNINVTWGANILAL